MGLTDNEAINELKFFKTKLYNGIFKDRLEVFDFAIHAIEEIQLYKKLGTINEIKVTKEKQIKKNVKKSYMKNINGDIVSESNYCSCCGTYLPDEIKYCEYCHNCGQALKW